jgi:hypothetical protein
MLPLSLLQKRETINPTSQNPKTKSQELTPTKVKQFFKKIPEFQEFLTKHEIDFEKYVQTLVEFNASGQRFIRLKPDLSDEEKSSFFLRK